MGAIENKAAEKQTYMTARQKAGKALVAWKTDPDCFDDCCWQRVIDDQKKQEAAQQEAVLGPLE